MNAPADIAFLFDVDNTLLDHDRVKDDLGELLDNTLGDDASERYWKAYESIRAQSGHADFLAAFQRCWEESDCDPRWLSAAELLLDYPFADRLYPGALEVLRHVSVFAAVSIVSDGDAVLQPRKIRRADLWQAVAGRVLIYQDKQQRLPDIARRFPARHYVMVDDKLDVLDHMKSAWQEHVTTVFPRQGHYAHDPGHTRDLPAADITVAHIRDLLELDLEAFRGTSQLNHGRHTA